MKKVIPLLLMLFLSIPLVACGSAEAGPDSEEPSHVDLRDEQAAEGRILLAAAASLKNVIDGELIPIFEEEYPKIKVDATYDSSGKLQSQIEEGADVDVFMSAAMTQMNALDDQGLIKEGTMVGLLENKVVLILPKNSSNDISSFEEILKADIIAVGDPESVPAGQYAKEGFENLGMWEDVEAKSTLGTNVTEVINWVAEGSADAGLVYATDAAFNDRVEVVAQAPEGSVSQVIYPIGIVDTTSSLEWAERFMEFLQSPQAISIFEEYGFTDIN